MDELLILAMSALLLLVGALLGSHLERRYWIRLLGGQRTDR